MFRYLVRLTCYAAFAGGIALSALAIWSGIYFWNFEAHSAATTGIVVSVDREGDGDDRLYCPKIRFQATDGVTYTVPCRVWEGRYFAVGDEVPIHYRKDNPNNAWRESLMGTPRESALGGVFALCVGLALRRYARKRGISLKIW